MRLPTYPVVYRSPEPEPPQAFFNPEATLSELRDWADMSNAPEAEIFRRLDTWLSAGGVKPQDWKHTANPEV